MKKQSSIKSKIKFYPNKEYMYFEDMYLDHDNINSILRTEQNAKRVIFSIERSDCIVEFDRKNPITKEAIELEIINLQKQIPICEIIQCEEEYFFEDYPSKTTSVFWISARNKVGKQRRSRNPGKWLIFISKKEIDIIWKNIKGATESGLLGESSKVSTAKSNPNSSNEKQGVICVYTYDSEDKTDVMRVREELRKLGIMQKIPYKTDKKTNEGKYIVKGDNAISEYYE